MKVLIVEDDRASSAYMKACVESQGHQTRVAGDGLKGLEVFQEFKPKLVIAETLSEPGN
ncbi:MAG: response regulator [Nitrospinae bacterium]|nr:response regulator [Nitrospinota bacterium]